MMIVMAPRASAADVGRVVSLLDATGSVHAKVVPGPGGVSVAAVGDAATVRRLELGTLPGVEAVVPLERPYKLASAELSPAPSAFDVAGRRIGPDTYCLIAGPCTVESHEQTLRVAESVAPRASMLRGGAFKPRTSPFAFRGLGCPALEILADAKAHTGLPVVTELTDVRNAEAVAAVADVIQIGARSMQNYALLEVVGSLGKPVLLKRGLSSTLDELLMAADYVLKEGTERVVLCERGIRTFETATRFTLDLGAVPWLKLHTHLPVIVDPSHAAGDRRLVEALACGAAAVGADGIIVEVHDDPESARCDAAQQLRARGFDAFAERVLGYAALAGRTLSRPRSDAPAPSAERRSLHAVPSLA
jgi:3-deoxy-7-phosphoheptulonate synthase